MKRILAGTIVTLALVACGSPTYEIRVVSCAVGPALADGSPWDGIGAIDPAIWDGLAAAVGAPDYAAKIAEFLANQAVQALEKPDPFGTAQLLIPGGQTLTIALGDMATNQEDVFDPTWPQGTMFTNVPLSSGLRMNIDLRDEDLDNHDTIGQVELNYDDLMAALDAKAVYQVLVADQAPNRARPQFLMVGISVRAE